MPTVLDTITDVEDRVADYVATVQDPVVEAVRKVADYVAGVLPDTRPTLPFADQLPTATELVESQFAFARRMLELQHGFTKAVVAAAAPAFGPVAKPKAAAKKAA
jgi:hypothetical protein